MKAEDTDELDGSHTALADRHSAQIDTELLQLAREYDSLAQNQEFSRLYPLTAGVIRELVGVTPMQPATPEVLTVLRDIWGRIKSSSEI